jgi:WD40 repeat protein
MMKSKDHCPQCGGPLPTDLVAAICPRCELSGALNLAGESAGCQGEDPTGVPADASSPSLEKDSGVFSRRRFGDYELLEEIARGGMGVVYRARQVSLSRIVAVKMLLGGRLATKDFVQRFRTESAAAASLQHPNIVAIHEVGFAEGQHFFAMDYVPGRTLAQLVAEGPMRMRQAAKYLQAVAEAIHFAHERNVLHRDLKPSNVLIDSATDQPRLTDFGLAKRLEGNTELTLTGQVLGSPNFMSPEQATAKRGAVGKRSDVFSLGAILYYLVTGRPPFQGQTLTDVLDQVLNNEPLAPHLLTPRVSKDLETICLKCLEKDPGRRYQTAQELADELGRFLRDEPIRALPMTPLEHGWRWCRRKPALASLAAGIALLLAIIAIGSSIAVLRIIQERDAAQRERDLAKSEREKGNQGRYDSDMSLAQHAWDDGDLGRTLSLLEAHLPQSGEPDLRGFEWFYFRKLCEGQQRRTFSGHTQAVDSVAISPDGTRIATGSAGGPAMIWDCATGNLITRVPALNLTSLAFGTNSHILAVGERDQAAVWDLQSERVFFKTMEAFGKFRVAFSSTENLLVLGIHGGVLNLEGGRPEFWNYVTQEKHVFPEAGGHIALSLGGDRLASGTTNRSIQIWELPTGRPLNNLRTGHVISMALSPDGQTLATSDWGSTVKLWDVVTGRQSGWLTNNSTQVWSLAFSPDGQTLVTAGGDQMLRLWNLTNLQQTECLQGHGGEVMSVAFSRDGQTLISGSKDRKAMLWDLHPNHTISTVSNLTSRPIFSTDGKLIAAGVSGGGVQVWDTASLEEKWFVPGAHDAVGFSTNGTSLLIRGTNQTLRTIDLATRTSSVPISLGHLDQTGSYTALSPDGRMLAIGFCNGTLTFFEAKTGRVLTNIPNAYSSNIFQVTFSPNGRLLATAGDLAGAESEAPAAKVWDMETFRIVGQPASYADQVLSVAFSPDGGTLACGGADDSVKFWDTTTWKEIAPALGFKKYVAFLAYSPEGKTLATACGDGQMKLWDVANGHEVASLKLGLDVWQIMFSPDGQTLAARGWDGLMRLWRAPRTNETLLQIH